MWRLVLTPLPPPPLRYPPPRHVSRPPVVRRRLRERPASVGSFLTGPVISNSSAPNRAKNRVSPLRPVWPARTSMAWTAPLALHAPPPCVIPRLPQVGGGLVIVCRTRRRWDGEMTVQTDGRRRLDWSPATGARLNHRL